MAIPAHPLRLGTRASPLAMAQAHMVQAALCAAHGWSAEQIEICPVTASGDRILDRALADVGGKALWTKELDEALSSKAIDFAVHSMKDVETVRPDTLIVAAMLPRADVRDRLLGAACIDDIPHGARIGTSSPRRQAQMLARRPDVEVVLFRGNVNTRLAKLEAGEVDATLLAAAGLDRLGMSGIGVALEIAEMLPAPSQGAVGIECRTDDMAMRDMLSSINHADTMRAVLAERAFLAAVSGDCRSPVAAHARNEGHLLHLSAEILLPDGSERVAGRAMISAPDQAGSLAHELLAKASPALRLYFGH